MASALLVYGSWTGSTAGIARRVGQTLTARGIRVLTVPAGSAPDPAAYDAVIIGSAVRQGAWHPTAAAWMRRHAGVLRARPLALFSVCLTPACHPERTPEARGYAVALTMELELDPQALAIFAGSYDPHRVSFIERARASMWGAKRGDFSDPEAIESWAREIVPALVG